VREREARRFRVHKEAPGSVGCDSVRIATINAGAAATPAVARGRGPWRTMDWMVDLRNSYLQRASVQCHT